MKFLITAGPTREPIDAVRYIANRSSGQMGAALAAAASEAGHSVTLIVGPVTAPMPPAARRIDVETASQMRSAVLAQFPEHDVLIMAAAVADYRPKTVTTEKLARGGPLTIECEPTDDILAAASRSKRAEQRTVGFSLEQAGNLDRSRQKLVRKNLDLIVYNPTNTMNSATIDSVLLWPNGQTKPLGVLPKPEFARILIQQILALFPPAG
ncbi:MAG TPA: phosphopantothenoylcysteine decarboxylase [Tepidisphaeraceae bacterium]|jgi:phosphopantothenoylcysteine decarboxylase/phosphopantothenate--cysteine ligase|nr:phosphopantothenoylcysteine decarboxylase [Tepidisphaeraceae bacterium]